MNFRKYVRFNCTRKIEFKAVNNSVLLEDMGNIDKPEDFVQ